MIKISALNTDSSSSSDGDEDAPKITKEAQEEITLSKYNKALEYQRNGKLDAALYVMREIIMDELPKLADKDGLPTKFMKLSYACHRNVAIMFYEKNLKSIAIDYYLDAAEIDGTDVSLWFRIGTVAIELEDYNLAVQAFQKGLECNPRHWPCLDKVIMLFYALREEISCLYYISKAFLLDSSYLRGLALRHQIYKYNTAIQDYFQALYQTSDTDPPLDAPFDAVEGASLIEESEIIAQKIIEQHKANEVPSVPPRIPLNKPLEEYTWLAVGRCLLNMYQYIADNDNLNFFNLIELNNVKEEETEVENDLEVTEICRSVLNNIILEIESGEVIIDEVENETNIEDLEHQQLAESEHNDEVMEVTEVIEDKENEVYLGLPVADDGLQESAMDVCEIQSTVHDEIDQLVQITSALEKSNQEIANIEKLSDENIALKPEEKFKQIIDLGSDTDDVAAERKHEDNGNISDLILAAESSKLTGDEPKDVIDVVENISEDKPQQQHLETDETPSATDTDGPSAADVEGSSTTEEIGKSTDQLVAAKSKVNATKQTNKSRRRSSLSMLEIWGWHSKRKSSRPIKPGRKQRQSRDNSIRGVLRRILPSFLYSENSEYKSEQKISDPIDESKINMDQLAIQPYFGTEQEKIDVETYWNRFVKSKSLRCDIITLLETYVPALASKWNYSWPEELKNVFIKTYELNRLYNKHPSVLDTELDRLSPLLTDAEMTLLYAELILDEWIDKCGGKFDTPMKNPIPLESEAQIWFIACQPQPNWSEPFFTRVYFIKSLLLINQNKYLDAIEILDTLLYELRQEALTPEWCVSLPNCGSNKVITIDGIEQLLKSLKRYEKLNNVLYLFDHRQFDQIIPALKDTFLEPSLRGEHLNGAPGGADRPMQIVLLLDCLWVTDNFAECLCWSERGLSEALNEFLKLDEEHESYARWKTVILKCLACLEACIDKVGIHLLDALPPEKLQCLVGTLTSIVCHQVEASDHVTKIPLETVTPWIILHHILQRQEDRGSIKLSICERKSTSGSDDEDDEEDWIPSSIMLLFTAHEHLGRHNWCAFNDGQLLLFTLDVVMPLLRSPLLAAIRDKVNQHMEQIFYCLYQHPSKKNNKVRYLIDHNVPPQKLSWERAQQVFDFFRPDDIPEFDAYKLESITSDVESLFKRVMSLIPPEKDPRPHAAQILSYIEGEKDEMPQLQPTLPYKISSINYLLADYYFKNNEFPTAFKFYTLDLCNNPRRLDSWAGMALSRASLLETKVNSCEPVNDREFLDKARSVQLCYKKSLEICPNRLMLWIEYGAFVYSVHSFCSRLMKTEADTLSMERFEVLETQKEALLKSAAECFVSADMIWKHLTDINEVPGQDERWLHQYMLGKIAEKQQKEPSIYMEHYLKSKELLHENNAEYPMKISYNNPQSLAVEALEIFYRIQASILKYIELHEKKQISNRDGVIFNRCLVECANSPFMQGSNKDDEKKTIISLPTDDITRKRTQPDSDVPTEEPKRVKIEEPPVEKLAPTVVATEEKGSEQVTFLVKEDPQVIMDRLMKQCMENTTERESTADSNDESESISEEKTHGKKKKSTLKSTSPIRRESQESTTTTATSTQEEEGSSSSSSSSSSSDDSSSSSSSSSSDSSDDETESSRHSKVSAQNDRKSEEKEPPPAYLTVSQIAEMTAQCLRGLEVCVIRFSQHYKALYRLAYHYFHRPGAERDLDKCRQLLLTEYRCNDGTVIQGLFSDRKNNNFFNGVWRIPVSEMDRPGSFASHMSRCVTLLMQVLRASGDHKMLLELCLQLKRTPDPDKKYLREVEREQLSQQALSLCVQCLRELLRAVSSGKFIVSHESGTNKIVSEAPPPSSTTTGSDLNPAAHLLFDVYREYRKVVKLLSNKESLFSSLLVDTYKQYMGDKIIERPAPIMLDMAIKFCQQRLAASRTTNQPTTATSAVFNPQNFPNVTLLPTSSTSRRKTSTTTVNRPRGRPPNINKHDLLSQLAAKYKQPTSTPTSSSTSTFSQMPSTSTGMNFPMNYPFHPLLMSAAMSNIANVDAQSAAALTLMMSNYQELMRQYQSNISLPTLPMGTSITPDLSQMLLNYQNLTQKSQSQFTQATTTAATTSNVTTKYASKTAAQAFTAKEIAKQFAKAKETKRLAPNKDSILKAVYGKEKTNKNKVVEKPPGDINFFKDRPYLSITQISPTIGKPPATSSGKTLQQKLAERQKQISPNKSSNPNLASIDLVPIPAIPKTISFPTSTTFSPSPPAAHTASNRNVYTSHAYGPIAAAYTSPLKSTPTPPLSHSPTVQPPPVSAQSAQSKKLKFDIIPFLPSTSSSSSSIPQISSAVRENLSITHVPSNQASSSNNTKSQTSKLLHFRKPNTTKVSGKGESESAVKKPAPKHVEPEIIVLDDDDD